MSPVSMSSYRATRGRGRARERAPRLDVNPMRRRWTPLAEGVVLPCAATSSPLGKEVVLMPPPLACAAHCSPLGEGAALHPAIHSPP